MALPERPLETEMAADVLALISGPEKLISVYGGWPSFEDSEVLSVALDRGNLKEVFETADWDEVVLPSVTVKFFVFDSRVSYDSPARNNRLATIRFDGIQDFWLEHFSHQNPIMGLAIHKAKGREDAEQFLEVEWGGTAMAFETKFLCKAIAVLDVVPFDPSFGTQIIPIERP